MRAGHIGIVAVEARVFNDDIKSIFKLYLARAIKMGGLLARFFKGYLHGQSHNSLNKEMVLWTMPPRAKARKISEKLMIAALL